jgi:hypothetical protein
MYCTYHDGGEFIHGTLQRRPATSSNTTSRSRLAVSSGAVAKASKSNGSSKTQASSSKKKGSSKVDFVWVLSSEMGYEQDRFHGYEEPTQTIEAAVPDGPDAREEAIEMLEEKAGEIWAGDGWEALLESGAVDYEDDTPDRCGSCSRFLTETELMQYTYVSARN